MAAAEETRCFRQGIGLQDVQPQILGERSEVPRLRISTVAGAVVLELDRTEVLDLMVSHIMHHVSDRSGLDGSRLKLVLGTRVLTLTEELKALWPVGVDLDLQMIVGPENPMRPRQMQAPRITGVTVEDPGIFLVGFEPAALVVPDPSVRVVHEIVCSPTVSKDGNPRSRVLQQQQGQQRVRFSGLNPHHSYSVTVHASAHHAELAANVGRVAAEAAPRIAMTRGGQVAWILANLTYCALDLGAHGCGIWAATAAFGASKPVLAWLLLGTLWVPCFLFSAWAAQLYASRKCVGIGGAVVGFPFLVCLVGPLLLVLVGPLLLVLHSVWRAMCMLLHAVTACCSLLSRASCGRGLELPTRAYTFRLGTWCTYEVYMFFVRVFGDLPRIIAGAVAQFQPWSELSSPLFQTTLVSFVCISLTLLKHRREMLAAGYEWFDQVIMEVEHD